MIQSSFVGSISNPITEARLASSLSANALAKRLGLSRQYLSRAEAATYSSLNPALLLWVANASNIDRSAVIHRYKQFQRATRLATMENVNPHKLMRAEGNSEPGHVLFERWRNGYWTSTVAFSNAFCVHPETVRTYEEGIRPQMPEPIRSALSEVNLIQSNWTDKPNSTAPGARAQNAA